MCIAIPGRVVSISGMKAKVDFQGYELDVNVGLVDARVDNYVLVHAGCAIEIMQENQAEELTSLFKELEVLTDAY